MAAVTRVELASQERLLPKELWLVYPVAPIIATLFLVQGIWSLDWEAQLRRLGVMLVPFAALTATFHLLYLYVMPRLVTRVASRQGRVVLHLVVVTGISMVVGGAVLPVHRGLCHSTAPAWHYLFLCVVISYLMIFPAMLGQAQRNRAHRAEHQLMAERQAALRAQLDALQARTNPHFFFNSINTVASLIADDPVLAESTLERLADLFRYALDSAHTPRVPLAKEFEMVRDFLEIQRARFGDRLSVAVNLAPDVGSVEVPPLLLQPLVENAIVHGFGQRPSGRVEVSARREAGRVVIEVTDDGPGPGKSAHRGTQSSVRELGQRLRLAFGEAAAFVLEAVPSGGCLARVEVPAP